MAAYVADVSPYIVGFLVNLQDSVLTIVMGVGETIGERTYGHARYKRIVPTGEFDAGIFLGILPIVYAA